MFLALEQILLRVPADKCPLMHGFSFILASFILMKDVPAKPEKSFFFKKKKNKNVQSGDRKTSKTLKIKTRRKAPRQLSEGRGEEREARERRAGDALPSHHHNPPPPNGRRGRSGGGFCWDWNQASDTVWRGDRGGDGGWGWTERADWVDEGERRRLTVWQRCSYLRWRWEEEDGGGTAIIFRLHRCLRRTYRTNLFFNLLHHSVKL